jgi:pimeloyl-ACP methyl ester carboxylesterase
VPTLLIAGERDRLTPPVHAQRLAEALPQCVDSVIVPASGHMTPLEAPGDVSTRLRELVSAGARVAA